MDSKKQKNKWEQGNGEVIGFAIMAVAICSIIVIMVSILQMSVGLNAITKAANVVGRAAAVCTSKEDAEEQIQKVAENAVTYAGIKNLRTSVDYASSDHEWKSGNFIKVNVSADVKTISPLTPFRQEKSVLICIENLNGTLINIPEQYNGMLIGDTTTHTHYEEPKIGKIWNVGSKQRKLYDMWVAAGKTYEDKIAVYNGYYLLACTEKFGNIGDRVQFKLENGQIINGIIADIKSKKNVNYCEYGHFYNGVIKVLEFETHKNCGGLNPGDGSWKPEWNSRPVEARNMGPYVAL